MAFSFVRPPEFCIEVCFNGIPSRMAVLASVSPDPTDPNKCAFPGHRPGPLRANSEVQVCGTRSVGPSSYAPGVKSYQYTTAPQSNHTKGQTRHKIQLHAKYAAAALSYLSKMVKSFCLSSVPTPAGLESRIIYEPYVVAQKITPPRSSVWISIFPWMLRPRQQFLQFGSHGGDLLDIRGPESIPEIV